MPNILDASGVTITSKPELLANFFAEYRRIYGDDILINSDGQDSQSINIFVQAVQDTAELCLQVHNSFDPDLAFGVVLDQRVAINGITRQGGTYTITPVTVTLSRSVNLYGIDQ